MHTDRTDTQSVTDGLNRLMKQVHRYTDRQTDR